jgi:hypothetical protein
MPRRARGRDWSGAVIIGLDRSELAATKRHCPLGKGDAFVSEHVVVGANR